MGFGAAESRQRVTAISSNVTRLRDLELLGPFPSSDGEDNASLPHPQAHHR